MFSVDQQGPLENNPGPVVSAEEVEELQSKPPEKTEALMGSQGFEDPPNTGSLTCCGEMSHSGLRD